VRKRRVLDLKERKEEGGEGTSGSMKLRDLKEVLREGQAAPQIRWEKRKGRDCLALILWKCP